MGLGDAGGRGADHRPAAPLNEQTSPRHPETPSRTDWLAGPPTEPPRAARSLLVRSTRQSEQTSLLIGQCPAGPAAEAGAGVSPRKGPADAPGGAGPDGRAGARGGSGGADAALTDALPHGGAEGVPQQKVHRRRRRAAIS